MKKFVTEIQAIDPKDGKLKTYMGPYVLARSYEEADFHCSKNGLGYCKVTGILESEQDYTTNKFTYSITPR